MRSNNSLRRNGKYRRSMRQILGFNFYDVFVFLFCIVFALYACIRCGMFWWRPSRRMRSISRAG